jgi:hypothetical protein
MAQFLGYIIVEPLTAYLQDQSQSAFTRGTVARCLECIGKQHPHVRDDCAKSLTDQLAKFGGNSAELNGYLVVSLADLQALDSETLAIIEQAFSLDCVDEDFIGDWEDFQVFVGLKESDPSRRTARLRIAGLTDSQPSGFSGGMFGKADPREKAKRKNQKEARRKNRRKKK